MKNPSIDRYLADKTFDHIDQALGRPLDPLGETYRNHYAINSDCQEAKAFEASLYWERGGSTPGGMVFYHVSDLGRHALADHLKAIADPHRLFTVTFNGYVEEIAAPSRAKARYRKWLQVADVYSDLTFAEFVRGSKVFVGGHLHG